MSSEEIIEAMKNMCRVECDGIIYNRIMAYTYRCVVDKSSGNPRFVKEVELEDVGKNSVTVASAVNVRVTENT